MISKHQITVEKTARFFQKGTFSKKTKRVWFVLHGYAQTADIFLESVADLYDEETVIIAPEGLSRFYWKDLGTNPVASWMTRMDRELDIKDTVNYLNALYQQIFEKLNVDDYEINYLGFSQGAPTLSRWIHLAEIKVSNSFFYAGEIAHDLDFKEKTSLTQNPIYFLYGNQDQFITKERLCIFENFMQENKVNYEVFAFEGRHKIYQNALDFIKNQTKN